MKSMLTIRNQKYNLSDSLPFIGESSKTTPQRTEKRVMLAWTREKWVATCLKGRSVNTTYRISMEIRFVHIDVATPADVERKDHIFETLLICFPRKRKKDMS